MKNAAFTLLTLSVLLISASRIAASPVQSAQPSKDTYEWHGELVALDQTGKTITVKSMVVGSALEELGHFKQGDRVLLNWSGLDKYASAVNHVVRFDAARKSDERFAFPAEFVAYDATQKYVTFKAPIPVESISKLQSLKPGQWVTATSPHGKSSEMQPIVAIRGYNDVPSNS